MILANPASGLQHYVSKYSQPSNFPLLLTCVSSLLIPFYMWIIELNPLINKNTETPLNEDESSRGLLLKNGQTYYIGRDPKADIFSSCLSISKSQAQICVEDESKLEFFNLGSAKCWIDLGNGKRNVPKGKKLSVEKPVTMSYYGSSFHWQFHLKKMKKLNISLELSVNHRDIKIFADLEVSHDLIEEEDVLIDGNMERVAVMNDWLKDLRDIQSKNNFNLSEVIIPKTIHKGLASIIKRKGTLKDVVHVESFQAHLSTSAKTNEQKQADRYREKQSQLDDLFDDLENEPDLSSYVTEYSQKPVQNLDNFNAKELSQKTPSSTSREDAKNNGEILNFNQNLLEKSGIRVIEMNDSNADSVRTNSNELGDDDLDQVNANLSSINLKRDLSQIDQSDTGNLETRFPSDTPSKKIKIHSMGSTETSTPDKLAQAFKQAKQMKIDQNIEDERIISSLTQNNISSLIKTKKFEVTPKETRQNPKVYAYYDLAYGKNTKWEGRTNYSNFTKVTTRTSENPIFNSSMQTVKLKKSNYKSNEMQINLQQNDDMIPELDVMFGDVKNLQANEGRRNGPVQFSASKKRTRGAEPVKSTTAGLFVESEDEYDNSDNNRVNSYNRVDTVSNHRTSNKMIEYDNDDNNDNNNDNNIDDNNDNDYDIPVFRSRKRR